MAMWSLDCQDHNRYSHGERAGKLGILMAAYNKTLTTKNDQQPRSQRWQLNCGRSQFYYKCYQMVDPSSHEMVRSGSSQTLQDPSQCPCRETSQPTQVTDKPVQKKENRSTQGDLRMNTYSNHQRKDWPSGENPQSGIVFKPHHRCRTRHQETILSQIAS